jgi:hypothetical protein
MLNYKTGIQKFILDRITQINDEIIVNDPEYKELTAKSLELSKKYSDKLTMEDKEVIYEQEDTWTAQLCRHEEIIYAEALKDGILFGYLAALVWQGGEGEIKV